MSEPQVPMMAENPVKRSTPKSRGVGLGRAMAMAGTRKSIACRRLRVNI